MRAESPAWWDRFWFGDGSSFDLAAARIVVALQALWFLLSRDMAAQSGLPEDFWRSAPASLRWRFLIVPGHPAVESALYGLAIVSLLLTALGVVPRLSALVAALLLYHLGPLEAAIWGGELAQRGLEVAILALVVLAATPCADAWSMHRAATPPRPAWQYGWPLKLIMSFVCFVYLFSGYGKLFHSGLAWVTADNMRGWLLVMNQWPGVGVIHGFGPFLASLPGVPLAMGVFAIVFELAFPLVLFSRTARRIIIPLALVFHLVVVAAMNLAYPNTLLLLVFVNWEWLRGVVRRLRAERRAPSGRTIALRP